MGIGLGTLASTSGNGVNNIAIGDNSMNKTTTDNNNLAIGNNSMRYLNSGLTPNGGNNNISLGHSSLQMPAAPGAGYTNYSQSNIAIGNAAMGSAKNLTSLGNYNTDNIAVGNSALNINNGQFNIAIGNAVMALNTTGIQNVGLGANSLSQCAIGVGNTALGTSAMQGATPGQYNVGISFQSLNATTGNFNIGIGYQSLNTLTSGGQNVGIGYQVQVPTPTQSGQLSIQNIIYGFNNTGTGAIPSTGSIGIGIQPIGTTAVPVGVYATGTIAKLHVNGTLRLDKTVTNFSTAPAQAKYLFVDAQGMVAEAPIPSQGISNNCLTVGTIPRVQFTNGNLTCSQITDDGSTTVQIGTNTVGPVAFTSGLATTLTPGSPGALIPTNFKLSVGGWVSATAYTSLSDQRLKKEITRIENPISKISKISGYTYFWNKDYKTARNLDDNKQAGFLAQEVLKVLPEAVVKSEDGIYGLNYNAIMPLLTEGIKEQQTQIETQQLEIENLKLQITELKNKFNQLIPGDVKIKVNSLEVVPNPITGVSVVSYKLDNANASSVLVISDLQGKLLKQISLPKNQQQGQVQVSKKDLPNGMYVFTIVSGNAEVQSKKVLVSE